MTQAQWGDEGGDEDKVDLLKGLLLQMHKRMDEHFGDYDPPSMYSMGVAEEVLHDFEIVFMKIKRFDNVAHHLDVAPEALKACLQFDFMDRYNVKLKEGKKKW